jgi:hypothetical protein
MRAKLVPGVMVGGAALAGAIVVFGMSVTGALLPEADAASPATVVASADVAESTPVGSSLIDPEETLVPTRFSGAVPDEVLSMAVERAPFDPERQAPGERYRMPDERVVVRREDPPPPERPAPPEFQILGTVASPNGGVAVVRLAGGPARVVSVGTEVEGYRVRAIESGAVVMSGQGWDMTFAVADPQPNAATMRKEENARNTQVAQARVARERAADLERLVQNLRGAGARQVEVTNGRAVVVGPDGQRREIAIPVPPPGATPEAMMEKLGIFRARPPGGGGQ